MLLRDARVNPADKDNGAIRMSSYRGRFDVAAILLRDPRVNPAANRNEAIKFATQSD
jgi:hypothetical protein